MQLAYLSDAFCIVLSDFIFQQIRAFHSLFKCSSFSCCSESHWISRIINPNWAQSFDEENYLLSKTNPEISMHSIHNSIMQVLPFLSHQSYPSSWPILYGNFIHDDLHVWLDKDLTPHELTDTSLPGLCSSTGSTLAWSKANFCWGFMLSLGHPTLTKNEFKLRHQSKIWIYVVLIE